MTPRKDEMNASESRAELLALASGLLASLGAPVLRPFLADWPASRDSRLRGAARCDVLPLPVLRWLPHIAADLEARTPRFGSALVCALCRAAPLLAWRQSYTLNQVGTAFLENYGWTELLGPRSQEMPAENCLRPPVAGAAHVISSSSPRSRRNLCTALRHGGLAAGGCDLAATRAGRLDSSSQ